MNIGRVIGLLGSLCVVIVLILLGVTRTGAEAQPTKALTVAPDACVCTPTQLGSAGQNIWACDCGRLFCVQTGSPASVALACAPPTR
jgi:hypothetical protein